MTTTAPPTADLATIKETAALLMAPGAVAELRILHAGKAGTVSGYFDDPGKLAQAAARYSGHAPAVYITLNPVQPALLARAHNRAIERARHTTADSDIERRRCVISPWGRSHRPDSRRGRAPSPPARHADQKEPAGSLPGSARAERAYQLRP